MKKLLPIIIATLTIGSAFAQSNVNTNKIEKKENRLVNGHKEPIHRSKENIERLKKESQEHEKNLKNKHVNSDTINLPETNK